MADIEDFNNDEVEIDAHVEDVNDDDENDKFNYQEDDYGHDDDEDQEEGEEEPEDPEEYPDEEEEEKHKKPKEKVKEVEFFRPSHFGVNGENHTKFINQKIPDWLDEEGVIFMLTHPKRKIWDSSFVSDKSLHEYYPAKGIGTINSILYNSETKLNAVQLNDNLIMESYYGDRCLKAEGIGSAKDSEIVKINTDRAVKDMHPINRNSKHNQALSDIILDVNTKKPFKYVWKRPGINKYVKPTEENKYSNLNMPASDKYLLQRKGREALANQGGNKKAEYVDDALSRVYGNTHASFYTSLFNRQHSFPSKFMRVSCIIYTRNNAATSQKAIDAKIINYETTVTVGLKDTQVNELYAAACQFLYGDKNSGIHEFTVKRDGNRNQIAAGGVNAPNSIMNYIKCDIQGGTNWYEKSPRYQTHNDQDHASLLKLLNRRWTRDFNTISFPDWNTDKRRAVQAVVTFTGTVSSTLMLDDLRTIAEIRGINIDTNPRFCEEHNNMTGGMVNVKHNVGLRVMGGEIGRFVSVVQPPLWRAGDITREHRSKMSKGSSMKAQKFRQNRGESIKKMKSSGLFNKDQNRGKRNNNYRNRH